MNTAKQYLLAPEWVVTVQDELTRNPAAVPFAVEPSVLGAYDAAMGNVCAPLTRGYRTLEDVTEYIDSFNATQAAILAALQDTLKYDAELEDYCDWIADQDYHRTGGW